MKKTLINPSCYVNRIISGILVLAMITCVYAFPVHAAASDIDMWERSLYGHVNTGSYLDRLSRLERDLYGSVQEGNIQNRVFNIGMTIGDMATPESLQFMLRAIEWKSNKELNETNIMDRVKSFELFFYGDSQQGAIVDRVKDLVGLWFINGKIKTNDVVIPKDTEIKLELAEEISSATAKTGDIFNVKALNDVFVNDTLVIPAGSQGEVVVQEASPAGTLFKKAKLDVRLKYIRSVDGRLVPLASYSAKNDSDNPDATTQLAVGASIAGLVLLGPIGAAAGFFIKGDDIVLSKGVNIRAVISEDYPVMGIDNTVTKQQ